jgi:hypothetical protein
MRGRYSADRAGSAADIAVDMMDNASALPTCPQRQQQQKTALRKWAKITHTTSRRGCFVLGSASTLLVIGLIAGDAEYRAELAKCVPTAYA